MQSNWFFHVYFPFHFKFVSWYLNARVELIEHQTIFLFPLCVVNHLHPTQYSVWQFLEKRDMNGVLKLQKVSNILEVYF